MCDYNGYQITTFIEILADIQYISKHQGDILLKLELWYHLAFELFITHTSVLISS